MKPCLVSSSSWMMSGRSRLRAYEKVVNAEARLELLGDRRAADDRPALEDQGLEPGLGQVRAVDQPVVAAADDDRVVGPVGRSRRAAGVEALPRRPASVPSSSVGMSGRLSWPGCRAAAGRSAPRRTRSGGSRRPRGWTGEPGRGELRADPGQRDVALQHRRVHEARGVADLADRRRRTRTYSSWTGVWSLGGISPARVVDPVVVVASRRRARSAASATSRRRARARWRAGR